jgi:hypothetical protein
LADANRRLIHKLTLATMISGVLVLESCELYGQSLRREARSDIGEILQAEMATPFYDFRMDKR